MIRVVADTNIYISALNFGGVADEVLTLARSGEFALFISPSILREVEGVLLGKFKWSSRRTQEALTSLKEFTQLVHPQDRIALIKEDEPDNRVLECAEEANAQFIVSGDKQHLQKLKTFRGITVLSPREFLESRVWS